MLDGYGRFSDGQGRVLGQVIEAGGPFAASLPPPVFEFSSLDLGKSNDIRDPSPERRSFVANPWASGLPTPKLVIIDAVPTSASVSSSGAETVVAYSSSEHSYPCTNCHVSVVADRNFDIGVPPQ